MTVLYVLAVVVRGLFLWEVQADPTYASPGHDEAVNHQIAQAILAGEMPSEPLYKAPLYMIGLAGIYEVLGQDPLRARWVHVVVDGLAAVLLAGIGRRLYGVLVGALAGLIGALSWSFVFYATELVDTSWACLLYLLLIYLVVVLAEGRWTKWLLCGVVLGLGAITRPNVLVFAPVLALTVLTVGLLGLRRGARTGRLGQWRSEVDEAGGAGPRIGVDGPARHATIRPLIWAAALTIGCCAAIAPVTIYNHVVGEDAVLIATYGGLNAYVANSPYSDAKNGPLLVGEGVPEISSYDPTNLWSVLDLNYNIAKTYAERQVGRELRFSEVDAFFYDHTRAFVREHPGKFLRDTVKRLCWFFNHYEFANVKDPYRLLEHSTVLQLTSYLHYGVWCPFAVLGVVATVLRREGGWRWIYYLAMLLTLFLAGLFFVMNSRYRLPVVYLLVPPAAFGMVYFVELWRQPGAWPRRIAACALLATVGLVSNLNLFGYATTDHTELQMTYAEGCLRSGRDDLLVEATDAFESAYQAELARGGHPWAANLHHCFPRALLFRCYRELGNTPKAVEYGMKMIEEEPVTYPLWSELYEFLLKEDLRDQARRALEALDRQAAGANRLVLAEVYMAHWSRFEDRRILGRLETLLSQMAEQHPADARLRAWLNRVREIRAGDGVPAEGATERDR